MKSRKKNISVDLALGWRRWQVCVKTIKTNDNNKNNNKYFVNGQFVRVPLGDTADAYIDDRHGDMRTLHRDHAAGGPADVSSANTTYFRYRHVLGSGCRISSKLKANTTQNHNKLHVLSLRAAVMNVQGSS